MVNLLTVLADSDLRIIEPEGTSTYQRGLFLKNNPFGRHMKDSDV